MKTIVFLPLRIIWISLVLINIDYDFEIDSPASKQKIWYPLFFQETGTEMIIDRLYTYIPSENCRIAEKRKIVSLLFLQEGYTEKIYPPNGATL